MRNVIEIALLIGSAAVALASPVGSPGAKPPMPKDDNEDLAVNVAKVGNCPVRFSPSHRYLSY